MKKNKEEREEFDNCLSIYMGEVSNTDLLSREEEISLFKRMQKWTQNKKCSAIVEKEGRRARHKIIKANLRLVIKIAKEFRNVGLDYDDLINEGNIGLMSAIEKYDLGRGAKLSYYASFWIKQSIRRAISNKGRTIRLPVGVIELKLKINKYILGYEFEHGKPPSNATISSELKVSQKKVRKMLKLNFQTESLNKEVGAGEDKQEMGNLMINKDAPNPLAICSKKDDKDTLKKFLKGLDERQRYIIIHRFGLDGSKPQTLEVIGNKFDLTRERIRQLELSALRTLREMYKKINKNNLRE
jgi:RNA polymerase primary sigma factor